MVTYSPRSIEGVTTYGGGASPKFHPYFCPTDHTRSVAYSLVKAPVSPIPGVFLPAEPRVRAWPHDFHGGGGGVSNGTSSIIAPVSISSWDYSSYDISMNPVSAESGIAFSSFVPSSYAHVMYLHVLVFLHQCSVLAF